MCDTVSGLAQCKTDLTCELSLTPNARMNLPRRCQDSVRYHCAGFLLSAGGRRFFGGLTGGMSSGCGARFAGWLLGSLRRRPVPAETTGGASCRFRARGRWSLLALTRRTPRRTVPTARAGPSGGRTSALPCAPSMAIMIKMLPMLPIEFAPCARARVRVRGAWQTSDKVSEVPRVSPRGAAHKHNSCAPACIGKPRPALASKSFPRGGA